MRSSFPIIFRNTTTIDGCDFKRVSNFLISFFILVLCFGSKAQVVINEVNVKPGTNSISAQFQSLKDCGNPTYGNEYVELYNTSPCTPIDISCYILATPYNGMLFDSQGSFRFPTGTIIPPLGFLSVGGVNSGASIILFNFCAGPNASFLNTNNARWYLDNFDTFIALYNASGTPIDAVYWTFSTGQSNRWNNASYPGLNNAPTAIANPAACSNVATLAGPGTIPAALVSYAGVSPNIGLVLERVQDGGATWASNAAPTLNGCNGTCVVANPFFYTAAVTQPSCSLSNGAITITPNPAGAYTYTWSPNVSVSNSASNLAAGTYSFTVSAAGCQKDTTITLTASTIPSAISVTPTNPTCGLSNGSVSLGAVTGGTSPYTYNFNSLGFSGTTSYPNLAAGSYSLIVQDASGCTYTAPNVVLTNTSGPTAITVTPTDATCGQSNGSVSLGAVTGGTSPYTYNFNSLGFSGTTSYPNLSAGSYTLIVQDASGCTYTAPNVVINNTNGPTAITVTPTDATCGQSNGSASLGAVTGGTSPYTYNFNSLGFSGTTSYTNLSAGNYSLIVQDASGCTYTAPNVVINNTNGPTAITVAPTNATCGLSNGSVSLGAVTGGTSPYTYNFNSLGFSGTTPYTNLAAGSYSLIVQDASGCTYTAPNVVLTNSSGPTAITVTPTDATCGQSNGSVSLGAVTGGTSPYTYNFNSLGFSGTTSYTNLSAGSYSLIVQDASGCTYTAPNVVINNTNGPTAITVTPTDATCGQSNGSASLGAVTGGTSPYTYNFNSLGFSGTTSYPNLSAGSYSLIVQDASGCTYTAPNVVINNTNGPTAITVTPTDATCGQSNGSASLGAVTGGTSPYTYNFNSLGFSGTTSYPNLSAGSYSLIVQDASGCTYTAPNVVINNTNGPTAITVTPTDATCGQSNGSVSLGAVTGGASPYTYNFNSLGFSGTTSYPNLAAGSYSLIVQDASGCTYTAPNVVINNTNGPTAITVTPTDATCSQSNGSVVLGAVTGGTSPYTYNFNSLGFSGTTSYTNLAAGSYSLIVQDASGCTYTAPNVVINNTNSPTAITVTPTDATCGQSNGSVSLGVVTGGTSPYTYNFNSLGFSGTTSYPNLSAGSYTLIVQDASGCTYTAPNVVLTNSSGPTAITVTPTDATCGQSNGSVSLGAVTGGTSPYTYNFNSLGFSGTTSYPNLSAGSYTLIVQDASGCTYTAPNVVINNTNGPTAIIVTPTDATCGQSNGSVSLGAVTGGTSPYTYNFNSLGFSGTTSYSNLAAGSYSLIVQDASGCTYTAPNIVINNTNGPTAITVTPTDATCGQSNGSVSLGTVTGGTSPYTYNFNSLGFSGTTSYPNLSAGSYTLIVQDASGCTYTAPNVVLLSTSGPSSAQISTTSAICTQTNGTISINNVVGGNAPYQYNVNNTGLSTNTTFSNFSTGIFPVQIIDNNGCVLNLTATVSNITSVGPTSAIYNFVQPECGESTGSIDIISVIGGTPPYLYNLGNTFFNTTTYYNFLSAGEYSIVIQDNNGCNYSDVASLQPGYNEEVVFAPNCFSPNDDSNNEKWFIKGYCIQDIQCNIFNRWGENIATLKSVDEKWDGTTKDNKVEIGVYVYVADITFQSGSTKRLRGRITVVR